MSISLPQLFDVLLSEINTAGCLRDIAQYWGFRSTVPGPGLRQASEFIVRRHREHGLRVDLHEYPADNLTPTIDGHTNPLAWVPRSASLEIIEPDEQAGLICSFAHEPLSLLSNSTSTPPEGITAEVVVLHSGTRAEDYENLDVTGKIILTDVWPLLADEQARKHNAVGLITDSVTPPWLHKYPPVRRPSDVPDLTMWGVLNGNRNEKKLWGFSLTPRQGESLRRLLRESTTPVRLRVCVDADLTEGLSEVVDAYLPGDGTSPQEVWVLSHSSEPGALDDASGCCLSIEIARLLKALFGSGRLPLPRRAIRFLNAVETEGYFPLMKSLKESGNIMQVAAALALDSVGSDFRQSGGNLRLFRSPDYNPSFADGLIEELIRTVAALPNERFTSDQYDLFSWQADPHFPGNDNFLADGYFDIPTPMLCNWPDKYYHSNLDTVDKLSPGSLGRAGLITAAYIYILACAAEEDAGWLAGLVMKDYKQRILQSPGPQLGLEGCEALNGIRRLIPGTEALIQELSREMNAFADRENGSIARLNAKPVDLNQVKAESWDGIDFIPSPLRWQIKIENLSPRDDALLKSLRENHSGIDTVWNWINGRRSAQQIATRLNFPPAALTSYLGILHHYAWIDRPDIQVEVLCDAELDDPQRFEIDHMVRSVFQESYDSMVWGDSAWYILVRVNNILACHVSVTDRIIQIGENHARIGGIGGVATLPQYRGRGLASLAMHRAKNFLRGPYNADFGFLLCFEHLKPYYASLGWQPITAPVYYDQPGRKIKDDGVTMFLPCRQTEWPVGIVDIAGYPF